MNITNTHGISLPLAVWLLHDDYDYHNEPNYISATTLLKSTKQIILSRRVASEDKEMDVSDFISARFGHAVHDAVEQAWRKSGKAAMKKLGYPDHICENIAINPTEEEIAANPDIIPVWIERRTYRQVVINGVTYTVGGKFDKVLDGRLFDIKTTSVWSFIKGSKDEDYGMQGGIYKWLNQDGPVEITSDHIFIQFVFTDWQRMMAKRTPGYPPIKIMEHPVLMPTLDQVEDYVTAKIQELSRLWEAPEDKLPPCNDKELWRSEPQYKFYLDPEKAKDPDARATKNSDTLAEAQAYQASKGGRGVIVTKLGEPKACEYCPAFNICKQKDAYFAERD